jgi:hypothetical protein
MTKVQDFVLTFMHSVTITTVIEGLRKGNYDSIYSGFVYEECDVVESGFSLK